ncbi:UNVERIFIED_CONTAM: hypothetical protein Sindi_1781400 [Sesamum indicum]
MSSRPSSALFTTGFGHLQENCQGTHLPVIPSATVPTAVAPAAAFAKPTKAKNTKLAEWTMVQRRNKGKANNAAKPTTDVLRLTSPLVGKVEKGRPATKTPQQKANEASSPADSSSSSTEPNSSTSTQHAMPGIKTAGISIKVATKRTRPQGSPPPIPMKIGFWNVRAFNRPLKHNGVAHLIKNNQLCLLDILETKFAASMIPKILSHSFPRWCQTNNFDTIASRRILGIWNPAVIDLHSEDISPQVIYCRATNKSSQLPYISFTYGLYSIVNRRSMWEKLSDLGQTLSMSWLIMGDFNCLKSSKEKQL